MLASSRVQRCCNPPHPRSERKSVRIATPFNGSPDFAPLSPQELLATSRSYALRQQADLQAALDELFGERIVPQNFVGIRAQYRHEVTDFAKLLEQSHSVIEVAPAQFEDIDIAESAAERIGRFA